MELPPITKSIGYTASATTPDFFVDYGAASGTATISHSPVRDWLASEQNKEQRRLEVQAALLPKEKNQAPLPKKEPKMPSTLRLARVVVFDPTEALPLDKRILVMTEEKPTDLTDQELFFELDVKNILDKHNAVRAQTRDKKASEKAGKDVFLEPIRIRDLRMTVLEVPLA